MTAFKEKRKVFEKQLNTLLNQPPIKKVYFGTLGASVEYPLIYVQYLKRNLTGKSRGSGNYLNYHWTLHYEIFLLYHSAADLIEYTQGFTDDLADKLVDQERNGQLFSDTVCSVSVEFVEYGLISINERPKEEPLFTFGGRIRLDVGIVTDLPS